MHICCAQLASRESFTHTYERDEYFGRINYHYFYPHHYYHLLFSLPPYTHKLHQRGDKNNTGKNDKNNIGKNNININFTEVITTNIYVRGTSGSAARTSTTLIPYGIRFVLVLPCDHGHRREHKPYPSTLVYHIYYTLCLAIATTN